MIHVQHRLYPRNGFAAHVVGYVGEVSEAELDTPEFARFHQGDIIGKDGLEREYNDILTGTDGQRRVEVDSFGNERRVLADDKEAIPGKSLVDDARSGPAGGGRVGHGESARRRGGARSAHRRSTGHGEPTRPSIRTCSPGASGRRIGRSWWTIRIIRC